MKNFSIGIPVYNEERNIVEMLKSIKNQKMEGFSLQNVFVYNDGSTDGTTKKILDLLASDEWLKEKVNFTDARENQGKIFGLNFLFEQYRKTDFQGLALDSAPRKVLENQHGDYLVLLDSDVILSGEKTLQKVLEPMALDEKVGLTSGWYEFIKQKEKLYNVFKFSGELLKEVGKTKPVYTAWGGIIAAKKEVIKELVLPDKLNRDDAYMYFYAKKLGYKYKFVPEAKVVGFKDFSKISLKRFIRIQKRSCGYSNFFYATFSKNIVDLESNLSLVEKIRIFTKVFFKKPVDGFWYFIYKTLAAFVNFLNRVSVDKDYQWRV